MSTWASIYIPNGTIAQLGERAIEVRKVAGSIPARPIYFCFFDYFFLSVIYLSYMMNKQGVETGGCVVARIAHRDGRTPTC
ncbi:uncharacterized protein N7487_012015 [Penicillium crustosum]|uniref:uncharacterized protein n=1 Tax=Penicillium crustosum TaxID=36656 RepID=UPI0023A565F6|nr:uncharacterized protein N7487_012015 [Penicillium crustosum]KAJ5394374.1 hypothetical protein N7487_012015 [Penicillium crustosum]